MIATEGATGLWFHTMAEQNKDDGHMRVFVCARICMHECAGVHGSNGREIGTNVEVVSK